MLSNNGTAFFMSESSLHFVAIEPPCSDILLTIPKYLTNCFHCVILCVPDSLQLDTMSQCGLSSGHLWVEKLFYFRDRERCCLALTGFLLCSRKKTEHVFFFLCTKCLQGPILSQMHLGTDMCLLKASAQSSYYEYFNFI